MIISVEQLVEWQLAEETEVLGENLFPPFSICTIVHNFKIIV
jgi:hypothetical protein